jgi:hypothetical protein
MNLFLLFRGLLVLLIPTILTFLVSVVAGHNIPSGTPRVRRLAALHGRGRQALPNGETESGGSQFLWLRNGLARAGED